MSDRIVVWLRGGWAPSPAETFRAALRSALDAAKVRGATACALAPFSVGFCFAADELDEALAFAGEAAVSFAVGVARGELDPLDGAGGGAAELAWGPALVAAGALAEAASRGEVLLEQATAQADPAPFAPSERRKARWSGVEHDALVRLAGERWRPTDASEQLERLVRPTPWAFREGAVAALRGRPGSLMVVRADPGFGGSRLLDEVGAAETPGRVIRLAPAGAEPLGALRMAFADALRAPPADAAHAATLARLASGEGGSRAALAAALAAAVAAPAGTLLLDDADTIDEPSLAVVAAAAELARFVLVARVSARAEVPAPLAQVPLGLQVALGFLSADQGAAFASSCVVGGLAPEAARALAERGRFVPLAVLEAVADALAAGQIAPDGSLLEPSRRSSHPAPSGGPLARHGATLSPNERAVLAAIAVLGARADVAQVDALARSVAPDADAAREQARLVALSWTARNRGTHLSLRSRSLAVAAMSLVDDLDVARMHQLASVEVEKLGPLAWAEAALHAESAGDFARAARLALAASEATRRLLGDEAADAQRASASAPPMADIAFDEAPPLLVPAPPPLPSPLRPRSVADTLVPPSFVAPPAPLPRLAQPPGPLFDDSALVDLPLEDLPPPSVAAEPDDEAGGEDDDELTAFDVLTDDRAAAGERMAGVRALARGDTHEALHAMRRAVERSKSCPPHDRCQALLAHAVALTAAGRSVEALLEALDALARAREASDTRGEQACARLLAQLSAKSGHPMASAAWERLVGPA